MINERKQNYEKPCRTREDARKCSKGDAVRKLVELKSSKQRQRTCLLRNLSQLVNVAIYLVATSTLLDLVALPPMTWLTLLTIIDPSPRLIVLTRECMNFS